jgi:hypothetical protein
MIWISLKGLNKPVASDLPLHPNIYLVEVWRVR